MSDNKDNINKLTSAYLEHNMVALSNLIDNVKSAMDSFVSVQLPIDAMESLYNTISQFKPNVDYMVKIFDNSQFIRTSELLIESIKRISFPSYDYFSLFENISLERDSVLLNEKALETLTQLFNEHQEPADAMTSQMSIKDFLLVVLLPLLCMIIPMVQNSYYHKLDEIETQKNQVMEEEYQEAIIRLEHQHNMELEELNNNLNELLQYLESVQDNDLIDSDICSPVPDGSLLVPDSLPPEAEVDTAADNSDTKQSED